MAQKWESRSLGSNFFQRLFCIFIKFGGRYIAYFILYFIIAFYTLLPSIRKKASYYLKRRFPDAGKISLFFKTYRLNLIFGKILTDRAILGIKGDIEIISSQEDQQLCKDLANKGKGLIILTAHCGCWQMAMSSFDFMEGDKYVVYHRDEKDIDKHAHELSGKEAPVKFIDPAGFGGGSLEIIAALEKKGIVCMMGDRLFGSSKSGIEVDFLNGKIDIPFSIYRIAGALGTPVMVVFFPYASGGKVDSVIAEHFFVEDKGQDASNYKEEAEKFIRALEIFTKNYPYQFFNYYNMWK